jgi:hypothetical protein
MMKASVWSSPSSAAASAADDTEPDVASLCPRLKLTYERCFQRWYTTEFLTGLSSELPCQTEYRDYQQCVLVSTTAMRSAAGASSAVSDRPLVALAVSAPLFAAVSARP